MVSAWIYRANGVRCASREGTPVQRVEDEDGRGRWDREEDLSSPPLVRETTTGCLLGGRPLREQRRNSRRRASKQSPTTGVVVSSGCPRPSHQ